MNSQFPLIIAYDMALKKPGCALLQPLYGGNISSFDLQRFGPDNWLLAPSENLKPYTIKTPEELELAIKITQENNR